jgi:hypothetical protein
VARLCFLASVFSFLATAVCAGDNLSLTAIGSGGGAAAWLVLGIMKVGKARTEMRTRKEAERTARLAERRAAEEQHAARISDYEDEVERLTKEHASAVARLESEHQKEWKSRDEQYQKAYLDYRKARGLYDEAQSKYAEQAREWQSEASARAMREGVARRALNNALEAQQRLLDDYMASVNAALPALQAAKQRFEKASAEELAEMRKLHEKRQELQLQQFLAMQLIRDANITNIGGGRKAVLSAHGIESALHIRAGMQVPGFGQTLLQNLMAWRQACASRFRFNPNAPLPPAEVNRVKIRYAQTKQSALAELRGGAAKLENAETKTRFAVSQAKNYVLNLARWHAQTAADASVCT